MRLRLPVIKTFLPRSFFGRAVMIVVVPILVIQIVLSVVFVQRHYERVTQQMTGSMLDIMRDVTAEMERQGSRAAALALGRARVAALEFDLVWQEHVPTDTAPPAASWYDLAGSEILAVLRESTPNFLGAELRTDPDRAVFRVQTRHGPLQVSIPRNRLAPTNPHQLLVIVFAASVIMILIALQYLRLQIRPIRRLGEAAEAYGRGQAVPLRASGATEVRAAALAFIDMRNRIERQQAQRKLMLSGLGHDIRTPLTRMRLMLSMVHPSEDSAALETEIADLEKLLNRFLDYAQDAEPGPLRLLAPASIVTDLAQRYRAAGHKVDTEIAAGPVWQVRCRDGQLERALDNVLSNAVDYGTQARVTVSADGAVLAVTVEDDGPGIATADRARVCEPFVRLDPSRNQNIGGHVGLGLAIVQDVMRSHGGRLTLDQSQRLGGLRVTLSLPLVG